MKNFNDSLEFNFEKNFNYENFINNKYANKFFYQTDNISYTFYNDFIVNNNLKEINLPVLEYTTFRFNPLYTEKNKKTLNIKINNIKNLNKIKKLEIFFPSNIEKYIEMENLLNSLKKFEIEEFVFICTELDNNFIFDVNNFKVPKEFFIKNINTIKGKLKNKNLRKLILYNIKNIKNNLLNTETSLKKLEIKTYNMKGYTKYSNDFIKHIFETDKVENLNINDESLNFYKNSLIIKNKKQVLIKNTLISNIYIENTNSVIIKDNSYIKFSNININNSTYVEFINTFSSEYLLNNIESLVINFQKPSKKEFDIKKLKLLNINKLEIYLADHNYLSIFKIMNIDNISNSKINLNFKNIKEYLDFIDIYYLNYNIFQKLNLFHILISHYTNTPPLNKKIYFLLINLFSNLLEKSNKNEVLSLTEQFFNTLLNKYNYLQDKNFKIPQLLFDKYNYLARKQSKIISNI